MSQEAEYLAAFDDLSDALFRHCFFRLSNRERATDLVQDTFMKAWDYLQKGEEIKEFRPFLYKILNNLIIDEYRKKKSESLDALLENENTQEGHFEDLQEGSREEAEEKIDIEFDSRRLKEALDVLGSPYKDVVTMRHIDGFSPKEIAEMTGESENVISVRIHRGVQKLQQIIAYG